MIADQLGYFMRDAPKLDFVPIDSRRGTMGWRDERVCKSSRLSGLGGSRDGQRRRIIAVVIALTLIGLWWLWGFAYPKIIEMTSLG